MAHIEKPSQDKDEELSKDDLENVVGGWSRWGIKKKQPIPSTFTAEAFGSLDGDDTYSEFTYVHKRERNSGHGGLQ